MDVVVYRVLLAVCTGFLTYYSYRADKSNGSKISVSTILWDVTCVLWTLSVIIRIL